jgi:tRNA-dihydrouridine synthase C
MSKLFLAPMDGLADAVLRDVLTRVGGYDGAVTEFVRVTTSRLPARTFLRACPELAQGSRTHAGTPVVVQLLGGDPVCMAENAAALAGLAPAGIDLNFGCPAPGVNRHGGGAILLEDPGHLYRIAAAVRRAVPQAIPVSAKMRLGVSDTSKALACAQALASAGIASLVVHARTRADGYKPPAYWEWIAKIREAVAAEPVDVIANGEVWTVDDHRRCRETSGCSNVMIGRGAVVDPFLARSIRADLDGVDASAGRAGEWQELAPLFAEFWRQVQVRVGAREAPGRVKLWLNSLRRIFAEAEALYWTVRPLRACDEVTRALAAHGVVLPAAA